MLLPTTSTEDTICAFGDTCSNQNIMSSSAKYSCLLPYSTENKENTMTFSDVPPIAPKHCNKGLCRILVDNRDFVRLQDKRLKLIEPVVLSGVLLL